MARNLNSVCSIYGTEASENNINNDLNETSHEDNLDANRIFFYGVFNVAKKQILITWKGY